jgi:hypothetical protein
MYTLSDSSPGLDKDIRIPNFNDGFLGAGPDQGAAALATNAAREREASFLGRRDRRERAPRARS